MIRVTTILVILILGLPCLGNTGLEKRSKTLHEECLRYYHGGDYKIAFDKTAELLEIAKEEGDDYYVIEATEILSEFAYHRGKYKDCENFMRSNLRLLESMDNPEKECYYLARLGNIQRHYGNVDSAFIYARKAQDLLPKFRDDNTATINVWNDLGIMFEQTGQMDSAIFYQTNLLHLVSKKDSFFLHALNYNLARSFKRLKNVQKEEYYLNTALSYCTSDKFIGSRAKVMAGQASFYNRVGKFEKAHQLITNSIRIQEENGRNEKLSQSYIILSAINIERKKYDEAELALDKASFIMKGEDLEKSSNYLLNKLHLAVVRNDRKEFERLSIVTQEAIKNVNYLNRESTLYNLMAKYHQQNGNYEMANKFINQYVAVNDTLNKRSNLQIASSLAAEFNVEKNELRIAALEEKEILNQRDLMRQRRLLWSGGGVLVLFFALSFFLYRLYNRIDGQKTIIQKALSEKDILLREIHHRVKNNLQLVSSLLTLQSRSISDESAIAAINAGKARVRSMALIHHGLYSKENLTGVSVKSYTEKLCHEIFDTYNINPNIINLELDIDEIDLDVETVVPVGLILNELITNCLKYAFPENKKGTIKILLKESNGLLTLQLEDNGVGIDVSQFQKLNSFGNRLVSILTEQLEGKMTVSSIGGTCIKIEINSYSLAA